MEKSGVKGRGEKRGWEEEDLGVETNKKQKVPALASVILEAMKMDSLQRFFSFLEPLLRRIIREEVELATAKFGSFLPAPRSSPARIEGNGERNLRLHFSTKMPRDLYTGAKVEGDQGYAIEIVLRDCATGAVVSSGPESATRLSVVVLQGDFEGDDDDNWTAEHFLSFEVKEREGKRPLLTGDLQLTLKSGVGTLGGFTFTDNSSWIKSRKFRLGVKVSGENAGGIRVREARSEAFSVKDHRGESYKKHYPPKLHDEVWRLEKIAKEGQLHKKLSNARVQTVEDFLKLFVGDPRRLRMILGTGMSQRNWDSMIDHARTCVLGSRLYVYYDVSGYSGVVLNAIGELKGLLSSGQFHPLNFLTESQKLSVDHLVKTAHANWHHVVEFDSQNWPAAIKPYGNSGDDLFLNGPDAYYQADEEIYGALPEYGKMASEEGGMGMGSEEIMEQDDMHCLLSSFTTGEMVNPGYQEEGPDRARTTGKRASGWIKIKAVVKWVIMGRERSAARSALRLEELD